MLFLHVVPHPHTTMPCACLSMNSLTPCLSVGGIGLWTDICHPSPPVAGIWNKATFLSITWPVYCLLSSEQPIPLSATHILTGCCGIACQSQQYVERQHLWCHLSLKKIGHWVYTWKITATNAYLLLLLFSLEVMSDSFATLWTLACQAPLSMEFSRQEYWSGLPFPPPADLPIPGIEPITSPALQADSLPLSQWRSPKILLY